MGKGRARLDRLIDGAICLGCLAAAGFLYLAYNWALTGAPFLLPRHLFDVRERIGFGEGVGFYGQHTLASGLVNADQLLTSLTIALLGWPFYLSLALIALPFLLGRATRWDWLHGAIIGAFVLTYLAYYYHGIVFGGPRYYFEALPSLILLTARGFATLGADLAQLLGRLGRAAARPRALNATLALGGALLACNLLYFTPRQIALYQGFSDYPRSNPVLGNFVRRDLTGRVAALSDAIVTTDDRWIYAVYLAPLNCPRLDCAAVFAYRPDDATTAGLRAAFPDRTWYTVHNRDGRLEIEPDLGVRHQERSSTE